VVHCPEARNLLSAIVLDSQKVRYFRSIATRPRILSIACESVEPVIKIHGGISGPETSAQLLASDEFPRAGSKST